MPDVEPEYRWLGEQVRRHRRERGLSQQRVADDSGLTRSTLANIETGNQRVAFHQFLALARALDMNPADLLPRSTHGTLPVDEQLRELGVPDGAARAVARAVGAVTRDADRPDHDEGPTGDATSP